MEPTEKKIPLVEVFGPTVQGEGAVIGQQTYFLRFGLCDMRCKMCDSMHAVEPGQVKQNATWLTNAEIRDTLNQFRESRGGENTTNWVTLSGGNPAIHDLTKLVEGLSHDGWRIAVETQGTKCPAWLALCDLITVSPKGPGMGEECDLKQLDTFLRTMETSDLTRGNWNLKVVVFDQRDLEFAKMLLERYAGIFGYRFPMFLSQGNPFPPGRNIDGGPLTADQHVALLRKDYINMLGQISNDPLLSKVRYLPQFHVWLWANKQGV